MDAIQPNIVLFRRDLRLSDNPALAAAVAAGPDAPIAPVYVLDEDEAHAPGAAARWWLHHSLAALGADIAARGGALTLLRGDQLTSILDFARAINAARVFWNRRYAPAHVAADTQLKDALARENIPAESFSATLLREPWEIKTQSGGHYRVFTPFWRALRAVGPARPSVSPTPTRLRRPKSLPAGEHLEDWGLRPKEPDWAAAFPETWRPGEAGAQMRLQRFLDGPVATYEEDRNRPDREATSRLSPHLAFGEISPVQIWTAAALKRDTAPEHYGGIEKFLSEVAWRDFSYGLLFFSDNLDTKPLRKEFLDFPWVRDSRHFKAWSTGATGYPIVDAGMRQLWRTGWMHNRVRMIVASFLVKHLLIPWQDGERWFWDTLVDADPANNAASWQWTAGCGADAAPYFRVFNPIAQGEKFDPAGDFTRQFVPEIALLPAKHLHKPWQAPDGVLQTAGVSLGATYPPPLVDHATARQRALDAFETIKKSA